MPQTFSSAKASSCCLALATSSTGPRMVTLSFPEPSVGKWMCTPPHSSMMERTKRPFDPIKELCNFDGMETSISVMFAWTKKSHLKSVRQLQKCHPKSFTGNFVRHAEPYQLLLNGQDAISSSLAVGLLSSNDDHLRVAVLSRQINLCVCLLTNLNSQKQNLSVTD